MSIVPEQETQDKKVLRFKAAYDDWNGKGKKLSITPIGREGYVNDKGRWYIAKSDGEAWIVDLSNISPQ